MPWLDSLPVRKSVSLPMRIIFFIVDPVQALFTNLVTDNPANRCAAQGPQRAAIG